MKKRWLPVISLAVAIVLLGGAGCAALEGEIRPVVTAATHNSRQSGIWVSGQGKVSVTPDIAVLRLGITAQAITVAEARGKAAQAMEAIMTALQANGVAEKDIQTYHFSISQMRKWDRVTEEEVVTGYRVSNMVNARIRALDQVGLIIDAVAEAGGDLTRIHGVGFSVEDPTAYQKQAREKAFADARAKAEQLAKLAGVILGGAIYITEGMGYIPPMPMPPRMAMDMEVALVTPIMPGEQEIIINVQVAFAIE